MTDRPNPRMAKPSPGRSEQGRLRADIVSYTTFGNHADLIARTQPIIRYKNRLKIGGYKLFWTFPARQTAWGDGALSEWRKGILRLPHL